MQNNQQHFTVQFQQNRQLVYAVISRYFKDRTQYEDLYQEVAAQAWQGYDAFRGESKFSTWLYNVARNTTISAVRRLKSKVQTIPFSNCLFEFDLSDNSEVYEEPPSLPVIDSFTQVETRTLNYILDGLSYKEISAITGESPNRIAVRMHRIKKVLSRELKRPDQE